MDHATIKLGEYLIPLIGIDKSATEYKCDKCKKTFNNPDELELNLTGTKFLCNQCKK